MNYELTPNNNQELSFERSAPVEFDIASPNKLNLEISSITIGLPNKGEKGDQGDPATNLVQSVNGKQGVVVLNSTDVGADPTGSASQALQDAKTYTDTEVSTLDSSLATVAKTGSYNDLSNKPTIPSIAGLATEAQVQNVQDNLDAHEADTANPHNVTKAQVGLGNVSNLAPADMPVSTATQTALNGKQNADPTLTALAAHNINGILTQTAADTFTGRTITGTANQITVTNGNGVSGNPTLSLPNAITLPGTITGANLSGTNTGDNLIIGTSAPTPEVGGKVLWLDTTGGNITLNLVTGD